jgi:hypothetical protein
MANPPNETKPARYLTEAHLDAMYDLALRSEKPYFEMLAAFGALSVNSKGRTSEIHGMKRDWISQEHPVFRFCKMRKGPLDPRMFYTMNSYKEIEVTRRWLSRHDQATNDDKRGRIWHRITVDADGTHITRNVAPLSRKNVGNFASFIAKSLHLPNWEDYKMRSFRRLGAIRSLHTHDGRILSIQD